MKNNVLRTTHGPRERVQLFENEFGLFENESASLRTGRSLEPFEGLFENESASLRTGRSLEPFEGLFENESAFRQTELNVKFTYTFVKRL